jgi:predicted nuclease of predicted toxin-antitoxin system
VTVRLLLDENLSERVLRSLDKIFPGSTHVRNLGGEGASDRQVWDLAKTGGFILTTRDEDFVGMSVLRGAPPKVVWLNVGNARNDAIVSLLRANADEIAKFSVHEEHTFLAIGEVAGASK